MVMVLILVSFDVHMQLIVVMAVRKAVSAATITFAAISMNLFFIVVFYFLSHRSSRIFTDFIFLRNNKISFAYSSRRDIICEI